MTAYMALYGVMVGKESRRFFTYRSNILAGLLSAFFSLAVRYALWTALFTAGGAQNSSLAETMTFYVVNDLLLLWICTRHSNVIGGDVRSGDIASRLVKPFPYHLHLFSITHAGALSATLTRSMPAFVIALCWFGLLPPVSAAACICMLVTALLGGVIYALIDLTVSYSAFWLTDYWYLSWVIRALFSLFGGMTVPMWFYPGWLNTVCAYLPFRYAVYQPIAFYLGRVPVSGFVGSLGVQLFWIAALFALERLVWHRAQKKLTVQGG